MLSELCAACRVLHVGAVWTLVSLCTVFVDHFLVGVQEKTKNKHIRNGTQMKNIASSTNINQTPHVSK